MLRRTAHKRPQRVAFVSHEGDRITYAQLEGLSNRFANGLTALGIRKGEHIALLSPNCIEQIVAFFGAVKIGAVVVPLNTRLAPSELVYILRHSDANVLIYTQDQKERVEGFRGEVPEIRCYVVIGKEGPEGDVSYGQLLQSGGKSDPQEEVLADDLAFLVYTAGTTGRPKGVLLTHNSVLWNCINWIYSDTYREGDRVLQVFPLYHVAAIGNVFTYIPLGGTIYLKKTFDPADCMETIQRERITRWGAAPTVFNVLVQHPGVEQYDTGSLTLLGWGAAIMPVETRRRLERLFPNAMTFDNYGMTEAAGGITTLRPEDSARKVACVGTELFGVEVRVVDEADRDAAAGQVGEIIFRGNNAMKGYYKDPEATAEAMRGGWMHTGDMGRLDEEGFLYIVDRKKDMIITGAENVYPREVEEVLFCHPKIAEAAVIGVADAKWGEAIKAVVTLKPGNTATEREIIDFCRERIAGFKCPKSVDFANELPKSGAGKILKRVLREQYGTSVKY